jgi:outer membrane protein assembly factor BamB
MKRAVLLLCASMCSAQDWSQWRGPTRDGATTAQFPATWPKSLQLKWKVAVGEGLSSPVVVGDAAYVHSRAGADEAVTRIDLATGKTVWRVTYQAPFEKNKYATGMAKGPFATPTVANGRVYTFGVTSILSCLDARDGKLIWRKDYSKQTDTSNLFTGTAMSPLVDGGLVIVATGDDRGGALVAFDAATGAEKWTQKGDGPGYATPHLAGRKFFTLTHRSVVSAGSADGKQLWTLPYKDEWNENIVSPVAYKDLLILSGVRKPTIAVRASTGETVWTNPDISMYMSTPVPDGDYLYGLSSKKKGQFFCLDARTGKTLWLTEGREATQASFVAAPNALLTLTDTGDLIVAKKSPQKFEQISRYQVAESAVYSHLVPLNHRILVKDSNSLLLWQVD